MKNTDGCTQLCYNTDGSYTCNCNTGYDLNADGFSCDGRLAMNNNNSYNLIPL